MLTQIAALSNANGVSGFEDEVVRLLHNAADGLGEISIDPMRNLYVRRGGSGPVVQLDAHTDEVSFMVQAIRPNGTLAFIPLGGWNPISVPAQRVRVRDARGAYIPGVVASRPPHFGADTAVPRLEDMSIDIGARSAAEAKDDFGIQIGQPVVPEATFSYDETHDMMWGKASISISSNNAFLPGRLNFLLFTSISSTHTIQSRTVDSPTSNSK
jgi:putative aminopeptidase FrvX